MSNAVVGELYSAIIDEVITQARNDFQEEGIDEATLQDFRTLWRARIEQTKTAEFPWVSTENAGVDGVQQDSLGAVDLGVDDSGGLLDEHGELRGVKSEDDLGAPPMTVPSAGGGALAAMRAAQEAQQRANGGLLAATPPVASPAMSMAPAGNSADPIEGLPIKSESALDDDDGPGSGVDGSDSPPALQPPGVGESAASAASAAAAKRKLSTSAEDASAARKARQRRAVDLDTSDIGSDLDDSDDDDILGDDDDALAEANGAAGGPGSGPGAYTILCLYDKVQRVKNKWKCILRDGLVTVHGKDYAFTKANGEFEW
ncbi:transcription factor IIA subunit alpha [Savitreella phatthalungensis]